MSKNVSVPKSQQKPMHEQLDDVVVVKSIIANAPPLMPTQQPVTLPRCCSTCRYWHRTSSTYMDEQCRRFPPVYSSVAPDSRQWPHTKAMDYCGEWEERMEKKEK